jgi:hypothetical protein
MSEGAAVNRIVLVPEPRRPVSGPRVRRYRFARLALNPPPGVPPGHDHLKRVYD